MTWLAQYAHAHPDGFLILGLAAILGVTVIGCFFFVCVLDIIEKVGRYLERKGRA